MAYEIDIEHAGRREAAVVMIRGGPEEVPAQLGQAFGEIAGCLREAGLQDDASIVYARFLRVEPVMEVEAGFTVTEPISASGAVQPGFLAECDVAHTLHTGPYDDLEKAVDEIRRVDCGERP